MDTKFLSITQHLFQILALSPLIALFILPRALAQSAKSIGQEYLFIKPESTLTLDSDSILQKANLAMGSQTFTLQNYKVKSSSKFAQVTFYKPVFSAPSPIIENCRWAQPLSNGANVRALTVCTQNVENEKFEMIKILGLGSSPYMIDIAHSYNWKAQGLKEIHDVNNQSMSDSQGLGYSYVVGSEFPQPQFLHENVEGKNYTGPNSSKIQDPIYKILKFVAIKNQADIEYKMVNLVLDEDFDTEYFNHANQAISPLASEYQFCILFDKSQSSLFQSSNFGFFMFPDSSTKTVDYMKYNFGTLVNLDPEKEFLSIQKIKVFNLGQGLRLLIKYSKVSLDLIDFEGFSEDCNMSIVQNPPGQTTEKYTVTIDTCQKISFSLDENSNNSFEKGFKKGKNQGIHSLKDYVLHIFSPYSAGSTALFLPLKYENEEIPEYSKIFLCTYDTVNFIVKICVPSAKTIHKSLIDAIRIGKNAIRISRFSGVAYFYIVKNSGYGNIAYAANNLISVSDPKTKEQWVNYYLMSLGTYKSVITGIGNRQGFKGLDFWGFTQNEFIVKEWSSDQQPLSENVGNAGNAGNFEIFKMAENAKNGGISQFRGNSSNFQNFPLKIAQNYANIFAVEITGSDISLGGSTSDLDFFILLEPTDISKISLRMDYKISVSPDLTKYFGFPQNINEFTMYQSTSSQFPTIKKSLFFGKNLYYNFKTNVMESYSVGTFFQNRTFSNLDKNWKILQTVFLDATKGGILIKNTLDTKKYLYTFTCNFEKSGDDDFEIQTEKNQAVQNSTCKVNLDQKYTLGENSELKSEKSKLIYAKNLEIGAFLFQTDENGFEFQFFMVNFEVGVSYKSIYKIELSQSSSYNLDSIQLKFLGDGSNSMNDEIQLKNLEENLIFYFILIAQDTNDTNFKISIFRFGLNPFTTGSFTIPTEAGSISAKDLGISTYLYCVKALQSQYEFPGYLGILLSCPNEQVVYIIAEIESYNKIQVKKMQRLGFFQGINQGKEYGIGTNFNGNLRFVDSGGMLHIFENDKNPSLISKNFNEIGNSVLFWDFKPYNFEKIVKMIPLLNHDVPYGEVSKRKKFSAGHYSSYFLLVKELENGEKSLNLILMKFSSSDIGSDIRTFVDRTIALEIPKKYTFESAEEALEHLSYKIFYSKNLRQNALILGFQPENQQIVPLEFEWTVAQSSSKTELSGIMVYMESNLPIIQSSKQFFEMKYTQFETKNEIQALKDTKLEISQYFITDLACIKGPVDSISLVFQNSEDKGKAQIFPPLLPPEKNMVKFRKKFEGEKKKKGKNMSTKIGLKDDVNVGKKQEIFGFFDSNKGFLAKIIFPFDKNLTKNPVTQIEILTSIKGFQSQKDSLKDSSFEISELCNQAAHSYGKIFGVIGVVCRKSAVDYIGILRLSESGKILAVVNWVKTPGIVTDIKMSFQGNFNAFFLAYKVGKAASTYSIILDETGALISIDFVETFQTGSGALIELAGQGPAPPFDELPKQKVPKKKLEKSDKNLKASRILCAGIVLYSQSQIGIANVDNHLLKGRLYLNVSSSLEHNLANFEGSSNMVIFPFEIQSDHSMAIEKIVCHVLSSSNQEQKISLKVACVESFKGVHMTYQEFLVTSDLRGEGQVNENFVKRKLSKPDKKEVLEIKLFNNFIYTISSDSNRLDQDDKKFNFEAENFSLQVYPRVVKTACQPIKNQHFHLWNFENPVEIEIKKSSKISNFAQHFEKVPPKTSKSLNFKIAYLKNSSSDKSKLPLLFFIPEIVQKNIPKNIEEEEVPNLKILRVAADSPILVVRNDDFSENLVEIKIGQNLLKFKNLFKQTNQPRKPFQYWGYVIWGSVILVVLLLICFLQRFVRIKLGLKTRKKKQKSRKRMKSYVGASYKSKMKKKKKKKKKGAKNSQYADTTDGSRQSYVFEKDKNDIFEYEGSSMHSRRLSGFTVDSNGEEGKDNSGNTGNKGKEEGEGGIFGFKLGIFQEDELKRDGNNSGIKASLLEENAMENESESYEISGKQDGDGKGWLEWAMDGFKQIFFWLFKVNLSWKWSRIQILNQLI